MASGSAPLAAKKGMLSQLLSQRNYSDSLKRKHIQVASAKPPRYDGVRASHRRNKDAEAYASKVPILSRQCPTPFSRRRGQSDLEKKTKFHPPSLRSSRFQNEYEHLQLQPANQLGGRQPQRRGLTTGGRTEPGRQKNKRNQ